MTKEEAIEKVREMKLSPGKDAELIIALHTLIPELRESEDERHRKWILEYLYDGLRKSDEQFKDQFKAAIAYLEKQKEQKPVTNDRQQECPYKDLVLVKNFFGEYKRKCKLSNKACESKECEQWNELQSEFRNINEAFEDGKKEVVANPEKYGLCKPAEWSEFTACLKAQLTDAHNSKYLSITDEWVEKLANELLKLAPKKEIQSKQEWSEEDKAMLNNLIWAVHMKSISPLDEMDDRGKYERYEKFLTSLPERFGLKPEREWSEEDELTIADLINYFEGDSLECSTEEMVQRIKSLRPSWKPSEEQN